MNRLLWGIVLFVVATAGWAQSTWRGQAEVWPVSSAPLDGFVAASNEFPRNSLLTVENYRSKKSIQVRIVAPLPAGSSALVLLNAKAAQALDIKAGDSPLVGVRLDPTGIDRADNPDPDVNPLAAKPVVATAPVSVPAPVAAPVLPLAPPAAPSALDVAKDTAKPDPALVPLPALAAPEPVAEPAAAVPLAVTDETEAPTPVTPGKKVFVTTRDPEPVAAETPEVVTPPTPAAETPAADSPVEPPATPEPAAVPAPVVEPSSTPVAAAAASEPVAVTTVPAAPAPVAAPPTAPLAAAPVAVPLPPANAWVAAPSKLEGPVLGQVALLPNLEKGRNYVQVGAYATEAEVLAALGTVKSYVPLALYKAEGEKNPWRVVVPSAPKSQLGLLLMSFRAQGYRTAAVVKG